MHVEAAKIFWSPKYTFFDVLDAYMMRLSIKVNLNHKIYELRKVSHQTNNFNVCEFNL